MKPAAALLMLVLSAPVFASISTVDFVEIKNGNREEAIYYYENNWLNHRIEAVRVGAIESFELLVSNDPNADVDILLITVYEDEEQYDNREKNFADVMSRTQRNGRQLLNGIQPGDFRKIVFSSNYSSRP